MKELTIVKTENMKYKGFRDFEVETIYFSFDGIEGRFMKTMFDTWTEYEVKFISGYAAWNTAGDSSRLNTCFGNTSMDLSEFMLAFKEKFGIKIPAV